MTKPVPTFRPIASPLDDVPDDALDQLVDKLAVPTLTRPEVRPVPATAAALPPASAVRGAGAAREDKVPAATTPLPGPATETLPLVKVSVALPDYLYQAMRLRVAEERTTMRYLVMQGLRELGFAIEPEDFIPDGRETRARNG